MRNYKGPATLTYADGATASGQIDMRYAAHEGQMSGHGYFSTQDSATMSSKENNAVLAYDHFKIRVIVAEVGMEGATLITNGAPL